MFKNKKGWWLQLVGWLLFICLPLVVMSREPNESVYLQVIASPWFWLFVLLYAAIFYCNSKLLIPYFFLRRKYGLYIASGLALFLLVFFTKPFETLVFQKFHRHDSVQNIREPERPPQPRDDIFRDRTPPPPPRNPQPSRAENRALDFVSLLLFVVVWVVSFAVKISESWQNSEKQVVQSEADKAQAELSFFKAQINPHFLFNTLNNIYSLAVSQHENTAPSILRLSRMMRYITEEATENFVPLEDEIECVRNYIDLQNLRLNDKTKVDFSVIGSSSGWQVTPLIFITFIENAFKYGVSGHYDARIAIGIETTPTELRFYCQNTIFGNRPETDRVGIGIVNTKKRLEYLYGGKHDLQLDQSEGLFTVRLKLEK